MVKNMKKILTILLMSILSITTYATATGVFQYQIPQPDLVTNDWDGDGIPNHLDPDDDNDNINDEDDSIPFGPPGGESSTPSVPITIDTFTADNTTPNGSETVTLSWSITGNIDTLTLEGQDWGTPIDVSSVSSYPVLPSVDGDYTLTLNGTIIETLSITIDGPSNDSFTGGNIYSNGSFIGATKNNSHPSHEEAGNIDISFSYLGDLYYISLVGAYGNYIYIAINDSSDNFVPLSFFFNFNFNIGGQIVDGASLSGPSNGNAYKNDSNIANIIKTSLSAPVAFSVQEK